jgi:hypothetical protein
MLYFNTTTNERYNDRTLALANLRPEDNDVHELHVVRPDIDARYEVYHDTQQVETVEGQFRVKFDVLDRPREKLIASATDIHRHAVALIREGDIVIQGHGIKSPVEALTTFKAWRTAVNAGLTFEPNSSPFTTPTPELTQAVFDDMIAGLEDHLLACDTVESSVGDYLSTVTAQTLKTVEPLVWAQGEYDALMAA